MGASNGCSGWYGATVGLAFLILLTGCGQNGTKLKEGNLLYDATEIFGKDSLAFKLAMAARHGDIKEIDQLVRAGADVNSMGKHDISPLWWAAFAKNYTGFKKLLDSGANPNVQRQEGLSVMFLISQRKDPRFLELALQHGGNPNLKEPNGETPLFPAVLYRNTQQIDLLIKAGADVNARSSISGETLPMLAMSGANYELVYELLQHGADPTATNKHGGTLADFIKLRSINADNNDDPWRKKVLMFLAEKGIRIDEK